VTLCLLPECHASYSSQLKELQSVVNEMMTQILRFSERLEAMNERINGLPDPNKTESTYLDSQDRIWINSTLENLESSLPQLVHGTIDADGTVLYSSENIQCIKPGSGVYELILLDIPKKNHTLIVNTINEARLNTNQYPCSENSTACIQVYDFIGNLIDSKFSFIAIAL
jgi:hypothetical protein